MKMTIGQVAKLAGVGVETVRFYEREGLLYQPARPDSGYRQYAPDVIKRIQFIQRAKELGFSLREIHELLILSVEPKSSCSEVKRQAEAKIDEIECKIADLLRMKCALVQVTERCSEAGPLRNCPILDALESDPWMLKKDENRQEQTGDTDQGYQCPICQLHFRQKRVQQQCEAWCRTHNSCNLQIAHQSIEAQKTHD